VVIDAAKRSEVIASLNPPPSKKKIQTGRSFSCSWLR